MRVDSIKVVAIHRAAESLDLVQQAHLYVTEVLQTSVHRYLGRTIKVTYYKIESWARLTHSVTLSNEIVKEKVKE